VLNSERAPASVLLAVAVALLVASAFELIRIAPDGEAASAQMRENYEAVLTANQLAPNLASVRSNARGFVRSANLQDRADYEASVAALRKQVEDMGRLPARDAADTARLARIRSLAQGEIADLSAAVASHGQDGLAGAPSGGLDWRRPRMEALRAEVAAFSQDQRRRLANEAARFAGRQHRMKVRALLMALLGAGAAAAAVIMLVLRRRRAEDALARKTLELSAAELGARRAAAFLEGVGNATPDLIYAKDRERRFVYANPATLRVFGLPPEQVIGRRSAELVVRPDEIGEHDAADRRVIETGESEAVESAFTSPDGANRVYRSMKFPLHDGDGAVIGVAGLTIDVTEAHAIRQALADSEAKYRTIANAMPAIVWTATADGRRDFYNDRWYEFTAAPPGATDGWEWVKRIHRLDRRRVETHVRRRMAEGAPYEIEYRLVGREGTCWVLERALPLRGENGAIQRWEGTCTDIQELYESRHERGAAIADLKAREAHLQSILDSVPDPMIVIDDHGIIQHRRRAAVRLDGEGGGRSQRRHADAATLSQRPRRLSVPLPGHGRAQGDRHRARGDRRAARRVDLPHGAVDRRDPVRRAPVLHRLRARPHRAAGGRATVPGRPVGAGPRLAAERHGRDGLGPGP
jgi:PAS domain S-box-containing protein